MKKWLLIDEENEQITIYPSIALTCGKYPEYIKEKAHEQ